MRLSSLAFLVFCLSPAYAEPVMLCDISKGMELINLDNYPQAQIEMILKDCDQATPNDPDVLLLHGLLARKKAQQDKNYLPALLWLEKANKMSPDNLSVSLELAITYELANKLPQALQIYQHILAKDATNRAALLGEARILRLQGQLHQASAIYENLVAHAPHDTDALNGLAWVKAAQKDLAAASKLFQETLTIQPGNQDALIGLNNIQQTTLQSEKANQLCNVSEGLILLRKEPPPIEVIQTILKNCEKNQINTTDTQLLHGLLARQEAQVSHHYETAIFWLQKAMNSAPSSNKGPAIELAVTYEWAKQLFNANTIYDYVLAFEPNNRGAILGKARVLRLEHRYPAASDIYQELLRNNSKDIDALNGLGWLQLSEKNFKMATAYFHNTLAIQPNNKEALIALNQIKAAELMPANPQAPCPIDNGLKLVNQKVPPVAAIETILKQCEVVHFQNTEVELLRGLLARHHAEKTKNYAQALFWLQKAMQSADKNNKIPALELALTYERANQQKQAELIYRQIIAETPDNKAALLGEARVLRATKKLEQAQLICQQLLVKDPRDLDALNCLGWIELAKNNLASASQFFETSLKIQPTNEEAQLALKKIAETKAHPPGLPTPSLCDADQGLILLNQNPPPFEQIGAILKRCDKNTPNSTSTLMLHALLARHAARQNNNSYQEAISWLKMAVQTATLENKMPLFELAVTYEWANQPRKALVIYQQLLFVKPDNTIALLGQARVLRALYLIKPSLATYERILHKKPNNIEALNGLGETFLTNYQFDKAKMMFRKVLKLDPKNKQTMRDLSILNSATKNMLGLTGGHYAVPPKTSEGINLFYFRNLNATDGLMIYATHNTKQIQSGFSTGPTLLPNNSLLLGYQKLVPNEYGWQLSYDARQHNGLPFEHRTYGGVNVFLNKNINWFSGFRAIFPNPWNTQLLISGVTVFTPLPFNVTATGFWSYQQIGGKTQSYALDFSKEYSSRFFYDIGPSYLPVEKSWEVHGRLIVPIFINQALVAEYSHYFFNRSTFVTVGWRVYWA